MQCRVDMEKQVVIVSDASLDAPSGNVIRIVSLASGLARASFKVALTAARAPGPAVRDELEDVSIYIVPVKKGGVLWYLKGVVSLIRKVRKLCKNGNPIVMIETSPLAGCFALAGFKDYVLDVHGLAFDETNYQRLPFYVPRKLYQKFVYTLEKLAVKHAGKIIAVSTPMKEFIIEEWKVPQEKITIVPNGYFEPMVARHKDAEQVRGMVCFIGSLVKWVTVDKIIKAAVALRDEGATFYIVGDGSYRNELERMAEGYNLSNVTFTGFVSVDKAYEIMARSEVTTLPLDKSLSKDVCCPTKLLEYMALGKAMVIDNVGELAAMLKENKAALVCNPYNEGEFIENIQRLLHDERLRERISSNAARLAEDFCWEKQVLKVAKVLEEISSGAEG